MFSTFTCAECGKHTAPSTITPVGAGHARPARFPITTRYCFATPSHPYIVGRGLDPSVARRGRRPLQRWLETIPTPAHARGGLRAGRPTISRSPPVGAGHARPATSPSPAVNLPPRTHPPKPPNPASRFPPTTPHNLCPPTVITPIYTLPKLLPQTLSKKSKKLAKTC